MEKRVLLIFVKNQVLGSVKTRLAADVGETRALKVYNKLVAHTVEAARAAGADRQIWYSSFLDKDDGISETHFEKRLQRGKDLGERMRNAFETGFSEGYEKAVVIGSDCPDINATILENAFYLLNKHEAVIGPSEDGGYYLLGTCREMPFLFQDMQWSTEKVFDETINRLKANQISYHVLPVLNDIDTAEDLKRSRFA